MTIKWFRWWLGQSLVKLTRIDSRREDRDRFLRLNTACPRSHQPVIHNRFIYQPRARQTTLLSMVMGPLRIKRALHSVRQSLRHLRRNLLWRKRWSHMWRLVYTELNQTVDSESIWLVCSTLYLDITTLPGPSLRTDTAEIIHQIHAGSPVVALLVSQQTVVLIVLQEREETM